MHFFYPVGSGSHWQNNELRYSLRSLANFPFPVSVTICGVKPSWCRVDQFIPLSETEGHTPIHNTAKKLLTALSSLPDEFVLMNDDFYVLQARSDIPVWHKGPLLDRVKRIQKLKGEKNFYRRGVTAVYRALLQCGIVEPVSYDLHTPFTLNTARVRELAHEFDMCALGVKTLYGNYFQIGGVFRGECKSATPPDVGAEFFSSKDRVHPKVRAFLANAFPLPSRFEVS